MFVSYRRNRLDETSELVDRLRDRGVGTWIDVNNLANEPTEAAIRATLNDANTSGAVLWLTPDVEDSEIIRAVEVPEAVRRHKRDPSFWLIIVLAGGLDYADAGTLFSDTLGGQDLSGWNLTKVSSPRATTSEIESVAASSLRRRLATIYGPANPPESVDVVVDAKGTPRLGTRHALSVDWTDYFAVGPPSSEDWVAMSNAARDVATAVKQELASGTAITLAGTPSIPAAILLGSTYPGRDGHNPTWMQRQPDGVTITPWNMASANDSEYAKELGWKVAEPIYRDTNAKDLAVCISVSDDVSGAFARSKDISSAWRAVLPIESGGDRNTRAQPLQAHEVASLVHLTIDAIRDLRTRVLGIESVHFFVAGPAGFGFLLGTRLATLPTVVTYEFSTAAVRYVRAAIITP
ncbi:SAVED domain-containing protein [Mycolicibacterium frederiksbergense]|uniref:SAVED domain-containing protein n=1 Tax=Mycolicibacterium frederiksbergense TaxID=117567 RepID=UPI00265CF2D1|nr:SAVED domain-containing protein [Mycolicibacterium frederiksbergense]